jgi:hypothetical protein
MPERSVAHGPLGAANLSPRPAVAALAAAAATAATVIGLIYAPSSRPGLDRSQLL